MKIIEPSFISTLFRVAAGRNVDALGSLESLESDNSIISMTLPDFLECLLNDLERVLIVLE